MHSTPHEDRPRRLAAEPGIELPVFDGPLCAFQLGDPSGAGVSIHFGGDLHATHPEGRDRLSEEGIDRSLDAAAITITDQVHEKILVTAREGIWCLPLPPELHDSTPYLMIWDTDGGLRTWLLLPPARLMIGSAHLWLPSVPPPPGRWGGGRDGPTGPLPGSSGR